MSPLFVKLEVTWADHPKLIAAGLDGRGLHATAMCISKRLETDGWLDRALLYREGADDALIDRLVELRLFDSEGSDGRRVRPHRWHDRNPSQGAIDATRSAKAEAARAGNHKRWKHPKPIAECDICTPNPQVDRISDRSGSQAVAEPSPDTDTETEIPPSSSLRTTPVPDPPDRSHPDEAAAPAVDPTPTPAVDEQTIRRTAALVGHAIAAQRPGTTNPQAYAAGVTRQILDRTSDGIDRARIQRQLADGQTPEQIAAAWATPTDPLAGILDSPSHEPAAPRPHPPAFTGHDAPPRDDALNAAGLATARAAIRGTA